MENQIIVDRMHKPGFWRGFVLALGGWLLSGIAAVPIFSYLAFNRNLGWDRFHINFSMFFPLLIILLFFWLPVAIIAGVLTRKKKSKAAIILVIISFFVFTLVIPFGFGILIALSGGF